MGGTFYEQLAAAPAPRGFTPTGARYFIAAPCRPDVGPRGCFSSGPHRDFALSVRFEEAAELHTFAYDDGVDPSRLRRASRGRRVLSCKKVTLDDPTRRRAQGLLSYAAARFRAQDLASSVDGGAPRAVHLGVRDGGSARDDRRPVIVWAGDAV